MRTRLTVTTVSVLAIVTVLGEPNAIAATVSPSRYAATVCQAIADLDARTTTATNSLNGPAQTFKDQPTQANAIAFRDALAGFLEQSGASFTGVIGAARRAGVPSGKHGAAFASAFIAQMEKAASQVDALATQARNIDVSSAARFASSFQKVENGLQKLSKQAKQRARKEPAFKDAAGALHPIVVYMTTDAKTCPSSQTATA